MKILVVCKRQYTGKDLIDDRYGRLMEIPAELALAGHEVRGLTFSYRNRKEGFFNLNQVTWQSINTLPILGGFTQLRTLRKTLHEFKPDVVWASSDAWVCIISALATKDRTPLVLDVYDNYDSFLLTKLPLIKFFFKKACASANGISAVTELLIKHLRLTYTSTQKPILKIGNAVDAKKFSPGDKTEARKKLGLPQNLQLFGTAGAINSNRGIDTLFKAAMILKEKDLHIKLVIAGPQDNTPKKYEGLNFIDLGILDHTFSNDFYNALDVAVICNTNSEFGNFCFPQKFAEICACKTNFVAAKVGELAEILRPYPQVLFEHNSPQDLANKIEQLLFGAVQAPSLQTLTWQAHARSLELFFKNLQAPY